MKTPSKIKNHLLQLILLGAALLWGVSAQAQVTGLNAWTASTTASTTGSYGGSYNYAAGATNFAVGSILANSGKQAVCTFLSATCDAAANKVFIWNDPNVGTTNFGLTAVSNSTTTIQMATRYDSTGTNVIASITNNLNAGAPLVIRHVANDNYEVRIISSYTATNITVDAAPTTAIVNGDILYPMAKAVTLNCGAATITLGPGGIIAAGQPNVPFLIGASYTTAATINAASGTYQ